MRLIVFSSLEGRVCRGAGELRERLNLPDVPAKTTLGRTGLVPVAVEGHSRGSTSYALENPTGVSLAGEFELSVGTAPTAIVANREGDEPPIAEEAYFLGVARLERLQDESSSDHDVEIGTGDVVRDGDDNRASAGVLIGAPVDHPRLADDNCLSDRVAGGREE